jgi:hypothetical protein
LEASFPAPGPVPPPYPFPSVKILPPLGTLTAPAETTLTVRAVTVPLTVRGVEEDVPVWCSPAVYAPAIVPVEPTTMEGDVRVRAPVTWVDLRVPQTSASLATRSAQEAKVEGQVRVPVGET